MLEIRPVSLDDYPRLALFLADFPNETRRGNLWLKRFNLWWEGNPAFGTDVERGWVLYNGGSIVGFFGVVPSRFQLLGKETRVFSTTTWRVLPEYRNHSLKLFFKAISTAKKSILFCTTPNGQVTKMLEPLKFQPIPRLDSDSPDGRAGRSVIITNVASFLKAKLGQKLRRTRLVTVVVSPLILLLQMFQIYRLANSTKADGPNVTQVKRADGAFDILWERTKDLYLNTNVRSADVINWYCFANENYAKELFACFRGDELLGYGIFWQKDWGRLKTLECLDLWVDPAHAAVITSLVRFAREYAHENSLDLVVFPDFTRTVKEHLIRLGLLRLQFPRRREYFKADTEISPEINASNSYFVGCQGDYGL